MSKKVSHSSIENLVNKHASFAKKIAQRYQKDHLSMHLEMEELYSAAMLGLVDSARRYDPLKQSSFCTYAYYRIRGAIKDYVRMELKQRGCDPSLSTEDSFENQKQTIFSAQIRPKADYTAMSYGQDLNDLGSLVYLLTDLNIKFYLSKGQKEAQITYLSEDDPEGSICLNDTLEYLKKLITRLPADQQKLLKLYYIDGYSLHEMTDAFDGLSLSWISRQHTAALEQIKLEVLRDEALA